MQPIQSTNHQKYFLQTLPTDVLGEICSSFSIKNLGTLALVSTSWNSLEVSNAIWKKLTHNHLPKKYQNLPSTLLKEKFKIYREALRNEVDLVLKNADRTVRCFEEERLFSKNLIDKLKDPETSLIDKCAAIKQDRTAIKMFSFLYCYISPGFPFKKGIDLTDCLEAFEFLLNLMDLNTFNLVITGKDALPLFCAVRDGRIDIAKNFIDAGADFNMLLPDGRSISEFVNHWVTEHKIKFQQEIFDEIAAYAVQKKLEASNN